MAKGEYAIAEGSEAFPTLSRNTGWRRWHPKLSELSVVGRRSYLFTISGPKICFDMFGELWLSK